MRGFILAAVLVAACGTAVTPSPESACTRTFEYAASIDDMSDSVSDFYPVIRACTTLAEWTAEFDRLDGAGFLGSATEVLGNLCQASEVADEPLCVSVR